MLTGVAPGFPVITIVLPITGGKVTNNVFKLAAVKEQYCNDICGDAPPNSEVDLKVREINKKSLKLFLLWQNTNSG